MLNNSLKFRHFSHCFFLLALVFLLGSCKAFRHPSIPPKVKEKERTERLDAYRDSLRLAKGQLYYDSGKPVFPTEWDSTMKLIPAASYTELMADSIIEYAKEFIGVPYMPGGNGPTKFDCSGFTHFVFKRFGYKLKRTTEGQLLDGWDIITNPKHLRRGDLVFFGGRKHPRRLGHVGIVVDNDPESNGFTFIHATVKLGVTVSASTEKYYRIRYMTACRILPEL